MERVQCSFSDAIRLSKSGSGQLKLASEFQAKGMNWVILSKEQAHELHEALGAMIAEIWPPEAEEPKPKPEPEAFTLEDADGDSVEVGLTSRAYLGRGRITLDMESESGEDRVAVWLTEAQVAELMASLEKHKNFVAQENAKPKPEPVNHNPLSCSFDGLPATSFGLGGWLPAPIGYAVADNPTEKSEPEAKTFHITINGDDITIWKE